MELSRAVMSAVRNTAKSVKSYKVKIAKLDEKIKALEEEKQKCLDMIESFETPIKTLTGGFTSEQVLNGEMDAVINQIEEAVAEDKAWEDAEMVINENNNNINE